MTQERVTAESFEWSHWIEEYASDPPSVLAAAAAARERGAIMKEELVKIAYWKAPRAAPGLAKRAHCSADEEVCPLPQSESGERLLRRLDDIQGMGTALASAVLGLVYPERFAVTDWRASQELHELANEYVDEDTEANYLEQYLPRVRKIAESQGLTPRQVDKALWPRSRARYVETPLRR
jgi:thermostable 8-oxoguanine DNA glycosylase